MENRLITFGKRLRQARIKAKLSMEALSEKMDDIVSKQAISKYEQAKMMPNSTILIAMANALDVTIDYFFRPFTFELDDLKVSFRKKSNAKVADQKALEVQIQDEVERYLETEEILQIDNPRLDEFQVANLSTTQDMILCAKAVRERWELGRAPITNVMELLERHGVKVLITEAPEDFDGVSGIVNDSHPIIVLNSNQHNIERRRLTSFHELCHLLFNKHFAPELTQHQKENLCNDFASEMLLPGSILQDTFAGKNKITFTELIALDKTYGISVDAIVYKLRNMGIVSEKRHRNYCIRKNMDQSFKKYVEGPYYQEESTHRFQTMVYDALTRQLVSISKAAALLHVSVNEVRKHSDAI